ncbi:MAG: hypothetical protein ACOVQL_13635 [Limnohabitans sp.]
MSIDNMGKPWATSITSCEAVRINPTTNAIDTDSNGNQVRTYLGPSAYPYNYGDMTGECLHGRVPSSQPVVRSNKEVMLTRFAHATLVGTVVIGSTTPPKGNWQTTFDGGSQHINWAAITWTATVPQFTALTLQMRVANSQGLLCGAFEIFNGSLCVSTASYTPLVNQRMISSHGQYMQVSHDSVPS